MTIVIFLKHQSLSKIWLIFSFIPLYKVITKHERTSQSIDYQIPRTQLVTVLRENFATKFGICISLPFQHKCVLINRLFLPSILHFLIWVCKYLKHVLWSFIIRETNINKVIFQNHNFHILFYLKKFQYNFNNTYVIYKFLITFQFLLNMNYIIKGVKNY